MKKTFYTTSEYIDALTDDLNGYGIELKLFTTKASANKDAQWLVDWYAKKHTPIKKPAIYRIKLEKVKAKKK